MPNISRREFNNLIMIGGTGTLLFPELSFSNSVFDRNYSDNMGLQLWSVGDLFRADKDNTIANIAKIGFKHIELPMFTSVESLARILDNYNLSATSRHFPFAYATGDWSFFPKYNLPIPEIKEFESVVEDASKHGLKHLVMPYLFPEERGNIDHYKLIAEKLNKMGEICQKANIQLNYHNHHFEFKPIGKTTPFEIIKNETDENLLTFQIDVFFVCLMGLNPTDLINNLESRVKSLHLKDLNRRIAKNNLITVMKNKPISEIWNETVELGKGIVDFKSILLAAKENNIENCYVEVEGTQSNSFEVLEQSFKYLKSIES